MKFPVVGQPNTFIVIWTTTPWTLPANLAVAYNSTSATRKCMVGEETLHSVPRCLLPTVAEKCGWDGLPESFAALDG